MIRHPSQAALPGCRMGEVYRHPSAVPVRWWMVCESGEWLLVWHRTDGRWQECFDSFASKGSDRVFSAEDYTGPWRPILNSDFNPIPAFGPPLDGVDA